MARRTTKSKIKVFGEEVQAEEQFYLGNDSIPTVDSKYEYTPKMIESMERCKRDICYFAETYFTIIDRTERKHITLRPYQRKFLNAMIENKRVIMLTSRQVGKTTLLTIYALWLGMFYDDQYIVIIANKADTASEVFDRLRLAYEELPNWLKEAPVEYNKRSLVFDNGSKIVTSATTPSAIRGKSLSCLLLDEFAFVEENIAEAFWASVTPTLSNNPDAKLFISSTPNGVGNTFWKLTDRALKKQNEFKVQKVIWSDVPGRNQAWKRHTIETDLNGDEELFAQEYECKFIGSSNSPFPPKAFEQLESDVKEPLAVMDDGKLNIWKYPENDRVYAIGVDVAEGVGKDSSVINVFDMTDLHAIEQVAMFVDNEISVTDFGEKVANVAAMYGNPIMTIERNGVGIDICNKMYFDKNYPRLVNYGTSNSKSGNFRAGVLSNNSMKKTAIINMKYWVIDSWRVHMRDKRFLEEMRHFEKNGDKWGAAKYHHDDLIMSVTWNLFVLHRNLVRDHFFVDEVGDNGVPDKISNKFKYSIRDIHGKSSSKYSSYNNVPAFACGRSTFISPHSKHGGLDMQSLIAQGWRPF